MSIFKDYVGKLTLFEGYHNSRQIWDGINRKYVRIESKILLTLKHEQYDVFDYNVLRSQTVRNR